MQKMEDGRRRAYIKQQVVAQKKQEGSLPPKGMGPTNPFIKRKPPDKIDHLPKKPKVAVGSIGVTLDVGKLPPTPVLGKGKGLITSLGPVTKKCPVLLCEDPQYALKQLSSIIKSDDYEDLGNHATEVMGEMGLFSLAQVCVCLSFLSIFLFLYSF